MEAGLAIPRTGPRERAILVGVRVKSAARRRVPLGLDAADSPAAPASPATPALDDSLRELAELARTAGAVVEETVVQSRERLDHATLVGRGKLDEIRQRLAATASDLLIFDCELTPTQQRNIEAITGLRVVDRTQVILDIFARHARTREGQLQVELAQLNYLLPRLAGRGVEMSRLGGGIGTRGPGETKLEMDRRRIRRRIALLEESLETVRRQRMHRRSRRAAVPVPTVALAGYTNAGKSTLFNQLTQARVTASPQMFATLDPKLRLLELPSRRRVLVSDTVGFIRHLPHTLIKAFRATLEEVCEADLILLVSDYSSPNRSQQEDDVRKVLQEIGALDKPILEVWNKTDLLTPAERSAMRSRLPDDEVAVPISALTGEGVGELLGA
ncbi:MAG: GTPase HflX, partial [Terriglobia bacterium]